MSVDRAFVVMTDGLSREDAYVAFTRAREATELYGLSREPIERAEFAPAAEDRTVEVADLGKEIERSEEGALAIDERLRGEVEQLPTAELVAELAWPGKIADDQARRRAEALRAAAIERVLAERRGLSVEAAIRLEPAYMVEAIGRRPAGLRARLDWERGVDRVESLRQALGVRDPHWALGRPPRELHQRARWREAQRELEWLRGRIADRGVMREHGRAAGIGIER